MPPDIFLINRNDPQIIKTLAAVNLPIHEMNFLATISHHEKRAELTDRRKSLRFYLGMTMGASPELIPLSTGPTGQVLVDGFHVSVASRGNYIAIAIGYHPIGIDIETSIETIPFAVLHPCEIEKLEKGNNHQVLAAMIWAAKESAWKCLELPFTTDPKSLGVCLKDCGEFTVEHGPSVTLRGHVKWNEDKQLAVAYCLSSKVLCD